MARQWGESFLLALKNGATFTDLAGMQSTRFAITQQPQPAPNVASGPWQSFLPDSGPSSLQISANGIFSDNATEAQLRRLAFSRQPARFRLSFANGEKLEGDFLLTEYERGGDSGAEETFRLSLQSSGAPTYSEKP